MVSVSMDDEYHQKAVEEPRERVAELMAQAEEPKPGDSKVVVKNKKIVLKELGKIKEAIRNLQSAVVGL